MPSVRVDLLFKTGWFDLSGGLKGGHGHSRWAIVVVGVDTQERYFILYSWVAHASTSYAIERFFQCYLMWKPAIFGVDATGMQIQFVEQLRREARNRQLAVPLRPVSLGANKGDFIERILQPISASGRLFRPPENDIKEIRDEMLNFPGDVYRDGLDALANAIRLQPSCSIPGLQELTTEQYRRHLQRLGFEPEEIQRKLALR